MPFGICCICTKGVYKAIMRILRILSGIVVLLVTLSFGVHLLRHILAETVLKGHHSPAVWVGITAVVVVDCSPVSEAACF